jgi:aldehyde dehydrogenase (NAD+)
LAERDGKIVRGGQQRLERGQAISPVLVDEPGRQSRITREDIFGPVLAMFAFDDEAEAMRLANDTSFGLAACVWSGDEARLARGATHSRLWVNSAQVNFPEMPVGGYGASGIGREAGSAGIRTYCEIKSIIQKRAQ